MSRKKCAKHKMPVEPVIAANDFQEYVYRSFLMPANGPAFLETEIKKRVEFLKKKEPHWPSPAVASPPFSSKNFPNERKLNPVDKETFENHLIDYAKSSLRDYDHPSKQLEDDICRRYVERKPFLLGPLAQRVASCLLESRKKTNSSSSSESCKEHSEGKDNLKFLDKNPIESCVEHSENNHIPEFPKMDTLESCKELHENNGNPEFPKMNISESCKELHENNGNPGFLKLNASESCGQHSENSDKPEFLKNNTSESCCREHSEKNMAIPIVNPSEFHEDQFDKKDYLKRSEPKFHRIAERDIRSKEMNESKLKMPFIEGVKLEREMKKCLDRLGMQNNEEVEAMGKLFLERRRLIRQLRQQTAKNVIALQNIQEKCDAYSNNLKLIKTKHELYENHAKHFNKMNKKSSSKKRGSVKATNHELHEYHAKHFKKRNKKSLSKKQGNVKATKHELYEYHAKHFNKMNKKSSSKKRGTVKAKKR